MNKMLKLIWDFRGPDAKQIAEHHAKHLKEFAIMENLVYDTISVEAYSEYHSAASIVVSEALMPTYRDALKPHRGQYV
ncbi:hypothetical protein MWU59_01605 [Flavobacteriaceae bacterium F08102]|nr:hypothetical protein [Flavobacteriaceae bacterium F08102]